MIFAAILAGGIGSRMGGADTPKQFLALGDKPVIIHTLEKFVINSKFDKILVVAPKSFINHTNNLINEYIENSVIFYNEVNLYKSKVLQILINLV